MKKTNSAVAKALAAIVVVILIVSIAAGVYFLYLPTVWPPEPLPSTETPSSGTVTDSLAPSESTPPPVAVSQYPVAKISASSTNVTAGDTATFSGAGSSDADGNIVSYAWLGPSGSGSGETYECQFTSAGTYTVSLTVTDDDGYIDYTSVEIEVNYVMYTLQEALDGGYVQANIAGDGSCCGDCINLRVTRLVDYTIEIAPLPAGTLLSTTGSAQNMVVLSLTGKSTGGNMYTPTSQILLDTSTPATYIFRAYCINFHKSNPESYDIFQPLGTADANVVKVLGVLDQLPSNVTSLSAVQTAIWAVTDNVSLSELQDIFPSGASQVDNAKTILEAAGIDTSAMQLFG